MDGIDHIKGGADGLGHPAKITCHPIGDGIADFAVGLFPQGLDHLAGINTNRTSGGTQAVRRTGILARVVIGLDQLFDFFGITGCCHLPADLPPSDNALPAG